jgi:hypothetical protein
MWVIMCSSPFWFFFNEYVGQCWPSASIWRYQRPPPLDYPDDLDTPDTEMIKNSKTATYRFLLDSGVIVPVGFSIVNGKKVYDPEAGVNEPRDPI